MTIVHKSAMREGLKMEKVRQTKDDNEIRGHPMIKQSIDGGVFNEDWPNVKVFSISKQNLNANAIWY